MLKKFILNSLSSFVGAWIAIGLFILGGLIFLFGMVGSAVMGETEKVSRHSILHILLGGAIEESESPTELNYTILLNGKIEQAQTLKALTAAIEKAKTTSDIDAIFIECQGASAAPATLNALRDAILDFKTSGKRVFAYGDYLTMGDYFVATAADALYLNPAGSLNLQGINGTSLYFKDLLDKIGVEIQTVRVGTFKSAVEPFTQNEMSQPARLQLDTLYGGMWHFIVEDIATARKVKETTIDSLVNNFIFLDEATTAKDYKLVDDCLYYRQVRKIMADYVGKDADDLNFVSPALLTGNINYDRDTRNQVAVLYASGDIAETPGAGINCDVLVPIIVRLAENDNVKGMVLRVNSPGGSVFGSEQIGEALDYFQSKNKPLAVSMGDYAASGGYWISAGADYIFADPLTITGSIGIFGMVPNIGKLADKVGVHPQTVGTNPGVMFPSIFFPMDDAQKAALQMSIDRGYEKFVTRVAKGRHKTVEYIKSIAEGRVWSAPKAKELGLVDELGGLGQAIKWVENKASIENASVVCYPAPESNIWNLLSSTSLIESAEVKALLQQMEAQSMEQKMIELLRWLLMQNHVQARSPYYHITL